MDYGKTWFTMGIFFLIAVVIWVGFSIYFSLSKVDINPNAQSYVQPIPATFDKVVIDEVINRVDELPVGTDTFISIVEQN